MKTLVIGLDGATWRVLDPLLKEGRLPNMAKIIEEGARGTLDSTRPPMTPLAWTSMATGVNPGKHGIYDFLEQNDETYEVDPVDYSVSNRPALWDMFDAEGENMGVINYPLVYPPPDKGDFFVSGIPASVDQTIATPKSLQEQIEASTYRVHPRLTHDDGLDNYFESILEQLDAQVELTLQLLDDYDLDCLWNVFMSIDWAQHYLWDHERNGRKAVELVYEHIDEAIGEMIDAANDPTVILVSDHGMRPIDGEIHLNSLLEREGFLRRTGVDQPSMVDRVQDIVLSGLWTVGRSLPPFVKYGLKQFLSTTTIDEMEEAVGYGRSDVAEEVDWSETTAFSYGYMGRVFIHSEDQYPQGTVSASDYERVRSEVAKALLEVKHPDTDEQIFEEVIFREDAYNGEHTDAAPDLLLVPNDWRYMVYGDFGDEWIEPPSDRIADHEPAGIIAAYGEGVNPGQFEAEIIDIAPTLLAAHGIPIPKGIGGEPLEKQFSGIEEVQKVSEKYYDFSKPDAEKSNSGEVTERLEDLGYL